MAKIRPYEQDVTPQGSLQTQATPASFGAYESRGLDALAEGGQAIVDVNQKIKVQDDVTAVHSAMTKAQLDWQQNLIERMKTTQPGDKTLVPTMQKDMADYFTQMRSTVATREGAATFDRLSGEMTNAFVGKAIGGQAELDALKAKQDYTDMVGNLSAGLITDPTGYANAVAQAKSAIDDPNSRYANLPAAKRLELQEIAKAQLGEGLIRGLVQNGAPELAREKLMKGELDGVLDQKQKETMLREADVGINAKKTLGEAQRLAAEREKKDKQEAVMNTFMQRIYTPSKENGGRPSYQQIMADSTLTSVEKQHLADTMHRRAKEAESDALTRNNAAVGKLWGDMIAADGDPKKSFSVDNVRQAYRDGKLNYREEMFLEDRFKGLRDGSTNTFERDVNTQLGNVSNAVGKNPMLAMQPEIVQDVTARIRSDFFQQVEVMRNDKKNPRDLMNPKSKDYFFSPEHISTYMPNGAQALAAGAQQVKDGARGSTNAIPPAKDRVIGASYDTPKGKLKWTADGWVQ